MGCQEEEKINSPRGLAARIGRARAYKAKAMRKTIKLEESVAKNMNLLARRSFKLLVSIPSPIEERAISPLTPTYSALP
jgi:hypothetical protein